MFFTRNEDAVECEFCGYKIYKPFPKNQLCPKCKKFLQNLYRYDKEQEENGKKVQPKEFEKKISTVSTKLQGKVKVKKKATKVSLDQDLIELSKGEYVTLLGITSVDRTPLFCSNERLSFLLELTNNLDFIASGFLGGTLDKMLLISDDGKEEKVQFMIKDKMIFLAQGQFPDKKGKFLLEQMHKYYSELVRGKDINNLAKIDKYNAEKKFTGMVKFILEEYRKLQEVFSDQEIPYVEDKIRIDYLGLSARSIGVISLLAGADLKIDVPPMVEDPDEIKEMKESILTARIEAIAANTYANTNAVPRWIAVKLGFQNYRFLTIKSYPNSFFLSLLSEGNLGKIEKVETMLDPFIEHVTDEPFTGNLRPYNNLKRTLVEELSKKRVFS